MFQTPDGSERFDAVSDRACPIGVTHNCVGKLSRCDRTATARLADRSATRRLLHAGRPQREVRDNPPFDQQLAASGTAGPEQTFVEPEKVAVGVQADRSLTSDSTSANAMYRR